VSICVICLGVYHELDMIQDSMMSIK